MRKIKRKSAKVANFNDFCFIKNFLHNSLFYFLYNIFIPISYVLVFYDTFCKIMKILRKNKLPNYFLPLQKSAHSLTKI
jgi:hypothetical protein